MSPAPRNRLVPAALLPWIGGAAVSIALTIGLFWWATGGSAGAFWAYLTSETPRLKVPDLTPLMQASPAIQLHVAGAVIALLVGAVQLLRPKGRTVHIVLGWTWVVAMTVVAISSIFITEINPGQFSPIHAFTAWTLIALPMGLVAILVRRNRKAHGRAMGGLFLGGLIIAGAFTFLPGRVMWDVFLG
jgi:uncharacterized membrane protein